MKTLTSIIRLTILLTLGVVAFLFLFGEEMDEKLSLFLMHFIIDKALAFLAFMVVARLYKRWSKTDPWFIAYEEWSKKAEDTPNPMYIKKNKS